MPPKPIRKMVGQCLGQVGHRRDATADKRRLISAGCSTATKVDAADRISSPNLSPSARVEFYISFLEHRARTALGRNAADFESYLQRPQRCTRKTLRGEKNVVVTPGQRAADILKVAVFGLIKMNVDSVFTMYLPKWCKLCKPLLE